MLRNKPPIAVKAGQRKVCREVAIAGIWERPGPKYAHNSARVGERVAERRLRVGVKSRELLDFRHVAIGIAIGGRRSRTERTGIAVDLLPPETGEQFHDELLG